MIWYPPTPPPHLFASNATSATWVRWLERQGYTTPEADRLGPRLSGVVAGRSRPDALADAEEVLATTPPASIAGLPRGPVSTLSPEAHAARLRTTLSAGPVTVAVDVLTGNTFTIRDYGEDDQVRVAVFASALYRYAGAGVLPYRRIAWATGVALSSPASRALYAAENEGGIPEVLDEEAALDALLANERRTEGLLVRRGRPLPFEPPFYRSDLSAVLGYSGPGTEPATLSPGVVIFSDTRSRARQIAAGIRRLTDENVANAARYAGLDADAPIVAVVRARIRSVRADLPRAR